MKNYLVLKLAENLSIITEAESQYENLEPWVQWPSGIQEKPLLSMYF